MQMKKFINDPENLTAELLEGLALANPDILELGEDNMVINKKLAEADRVTIVTQGGSGHEPAIEGFVGEGMVDIDVVGDIFAAPGPQACVDAIKLADKGKGVLYIVLNHAGDMLTGNMTMKQCKKQGLNVVKVVTQEDVSNAPRENADDRRGWWAASPRTRSPAQRPPRAEASRRLPPSRSASPTTWPPWPWPCAAPRIRRRARFWPSSAMTRWKSAWASTARRAADASP